MADKKPLSDKKLRRMLKIQHMKQEKKQEKKKEKNSEEKVKEAQKKKLKVRDALNQLTKELERHPKHLKGKEIGLWYRDRNRRNKLIEQMNSLDTQLLSKSKVQTSPSKEKKLTKGERKAQKEIETKTLVALKRREKEKMDKKNKCFKIAFDPERERMIKEYLSSVENKPPSFLIPLSEYHKRLKVKCEPSDTNQTMTFQGVSISEDEDIKDILKTTKQLSETFPCNISSGLTTNQIQAFLEGETDSKCYSLCKGGLYEEQNSDTKKRTLECSANLSSDDTRMMDSIDKYKHLEETPFKQSFLAVLSSNIQENLQSAVRRKSLNRLTHVDRDLYISFQNKVENRRYKHMLNGRRKLPAFQMQDAIMNLIRNNQVVLISGETGCGKTTQVAQFILDEAIQSGNGSMCNIICTQPRRISAISVAQRVADERAEVLGRESIGYQIRLERNIGRYRGAILYCTTGILLQYLQGDPALSKYSHVILDEIHERDTLCDFVLTILRDIAAKRHDLKIILMSATLNAEQFSNYFGNCPSMNIPGYTYPVQEFYLEDVLLQTKFAFQIKKCREAEDKNFKTHVLPYVESIKHKYPNHVIEGLRNPESEKVNPDLIIALIKHICTFCGPGAILVFVPGWDYISCTLKKMNEDSFFSRSGFLIIPLHSMMPSENQQSVFDRPPSGQRKIVIATNIAETSITINDVVYVIDSGKSKIKNYDVINNISTLKAEFVSLANARQRRGRAGRVQSGVCYHLFSRGREKILSDYPLPEMVRTRLEEVILSIKLLQLGKASPFLEKVMDPPNPRAVSLAIQLLIQLNALDENENLTPLGFHLAKLPLDPQIGKMLLMGVTMSCLNPILSIAATLSFKDPFHVPLGEERTVKDRKLELDKGHKSDHLLMAEVIEQWADQERRGKGKSFCTYYFLNRRTLQQLSEQKQLFTQYLLDMGFLSDNNYRHRNLNMNSCNIALVKAVICSGLYPNVAVIQRHLNTGGTKRVLLRTSENGKVSLHSKSVNTVQTNEFESLFLLYHEKLMSSCILIFDTTMVSTLPLLVFCYDFYITYSKNNAIIELNKDLRFECSKKTAYYITELKLRLHWLLEYKLSHPGQVQWKDESSEIGLLRTLTELFTNENDLVMGVKDDSSDE